METLLVWGLALIAIAFLLLVVEIFLPTGGVISVTALLVAVAGVVCLYQHQTVWGVIGTLAVVVGGPVLFFFGIQIMPNTPLGRKLIPPNPRELAEGRPPPTNELAKLVGQEGVVLSDLRPIGTIRIGEKRYDALSETSLVRAGSRIRVVAVDGNDVRVRPV